MGTVTWLGAIEQACYLFLHTVAKLTNDFPEVESLSTIYVHPSKTKTLS